MVYVISNIHGDYQKYLQMLRLISFKESDLLYILGDIVDYGDQSMELIGDLSVRCNVYPIVGEHDYRAVRMLIGFEKMLKSGNEKPDPDFISEMTEWVEDGGQPTLDSYRELDAEMREGAIDYLSDMSLYEVVEAGGKKFLLVHAGIDGFRAGMTLDHLDELEPEAFFTEPLDYSKKYFDGVTVVTGHTPTTEITDGQGSIFYGNGSIDIDCGLKDGGRLACLCLDNGKEYYV